jgi:hypothetical protein
MKVRCITNKLNWFLSPHRFLTPHNIYDVYDGSLEGHYLILNDVGRLVDAPKGLFIPLEEHRENLLNNLGI